MDSLKIEFLYQTEIKEQYEIKIPKEVYKHLLEWSSEDDLDYFWNYDTRNDTLLISPEKPRTEKINKLKETVDHDIGRRTCVPKPVRNKLGFELEDNLYLWTHDKMETTGAPSVMVWDFNQMEELILEKVRDMSEDELFPNF